MPEARTSSKIKAVGLLSGGLDSTLAAKLIMQQNIEVHAINFTSPFCTCTPKSAGCAAVVTAVKSLGDIPLKHVGLGEEYLELIRHPKLLVRQIYLGLIGMYVASLESSCGMLCRSLNLYLRTNWLQYITLSIQRRSPTDPSNPLSINGMSFSPMVSEWLQSGVQMRML